MAMMRKIDALVVGAGPVGLVTALSLVRSGRLGIEIIDEADRRTGFSYAPALHPGALEVLEGLGVLGRLSAHGNPIDRVAIYDGAVRRIALELGGLNRPHPFVLAIPQDALEGALLAALAEHGVEVRWHHRLRHIEPGADEAAYCTIDRIDAVPSGYAVARVGGVVGKTFERRIPLVVGADGHGSLVRRQLGLERRATGRAGMVAVFELDGEPLPADVPEIDARHELRINVSHGMRCVWWPLPGGRTRLGFELLGDEVETTARGKSRLPPIVPWLARTLDETRLRELVAERLPWHAVPQGRLMWSAAVRFERAQADAFGRGQIWLAGDAAHLAFPFGVHSMNAGIEEAEELATRGARVLDGTDPGASLQIYGRERLEQWQRLPAGWDAVAAALGALGDPWLTANAPGIAEALPLAPGDAQRLLAGVTGSARSAHG